MLHHRAYLSQGLSDNHMDLCREKEYRRDWNAHLLTVSNGKSGECKAVKKELGQCAQAPDMPDATENMANTMAFADSDAVATPDPASRDGEATRR